MEDPRIISALFISLKMAYYNVLINIQRSKHTICTYISVGFFSKPATLIMPVTLYGFS